MSKLIWRLIDRRVDAAITARIVTFHNAMVERGQIAPPNPQLPDYRAARARFAAPRSEQPIVDLEERFG